MADNTEKFYQMLHPELKTRLNLVIDHMKDLGWKPVVPTLIGKEATGYRDLAEQAASKRKGRSQVSAGFHNTTDSAGNPQSMAVHLTTQGYSKNKNIQQAFNEDLYNVANKYGLTTGLYWKDKKGKSKPDPLHLQLFDNKSLGRVLTHKQAPFLTNKFNLIPPTLGKFKNFPTNPATVNHFMMGDRFNLRSNFAKPANPFHFENPATKFKPYVPPPSMHNLNNKMNLHSDWLERANRNQFNNNNFRQMSFKKPSFDIGNLRQGSSYSNFNQSNFKLRFDKPGTSMNIFKPQNNLNLGNYSQNLKLNMKF